MKAGKSQGPNGRVDLFKNLSQRNEIGDSYLLSEIELQNLADYF